MGRLLLIEPDEALGVDHLRGHQPSATELTHNLPEGVVGKARHWRLENRRVDQQGADEKRLCQRAVGYRLSAIGKSAHTQAKQMASGQSRWSLAIVTRH